MAEEEARRRYFLVQSNGDTAHHWTRKFEDRTYAEELQDHHYYRNDAWQTKKRDSDFAFVRAGDRVLQYCTMNVAEAPGRIRDVWEVTAVDPVTEDDVRDALKTGSVSEDEAKELLENKHVLRLRLYEKLDGGVPISAIREAVDQGMLSQNMANCGRVGFNICQVEESDFEVLHELKPRPGYEVTLFEDQLQSYLAGKKTAGAIDPELEAFNLFVDEDGNTGDEYYTGTVGRIDLLYVDEDGNFLVLELKRTDDTPDKVVGQLARYMGWVRNKLAKGKKVRGAVVTHSASTELQYAVDAFPDTSLYEFEVKFDFEKAESL